MQPCVMCHQFHTGYCSQGNGTGALVFQTPPTHYHYAQDLCGGHCWCKEVKVGKIKHDKCCNCGLKSKK